MFFDNHGVRNGQSLSGSLAGFFGGKEKIKNFVPDFFRDAGTGIADANFSLAAFVNRTDVDGAFLGLVVFIFLSNGMGGIDRTGEKAWIGRAWGDYNNGIPLDPVLQEQALREGALWPYCKNIEARRCPTGWRGELQSYNVFDGMNGLARNGTHANGKGLRKGKTVLWIKRLTDITDPSPAYRGVFLDEGRTTPDSYAVHYDHEEWWDPPLIRHGDGDTLSYADGHAGYYKFKDKRTLEAGYLELENKYWSQATKVQPNNEDLRFIVKTCWGALGFR